MLSGWLLVGIFQIVDLNFGSHWGVFGGRSVSLYHFMGVLVFHRDHNLNYFCVLILQAVFINLLRNGFSRIHIQGLFDN